MCVLRGLERGSEQPPAETCGSTQLPPFGQFRAGGMLYFVHQPITPSRGTYQTTGNKKKRTMDIEDTNEDLFGELFGSSTKKAARTISPSRSHQSAKVEESVSESEDDDFALPATTPSKPAAATDGVPPPAETKESMVDGEDGPSGMEIIIGM